MWSLGHRIAPLPIPCHQRPALRGSLLAVLLLALGLLVGCASLPDDYSRVPSAAIENHQDTRLGQIIDPPAWAEAGESGFLLLPNGREAFTTRIALIDLAEQSIDLQYYIWQPDMTGRILGRRLLFAADRGVRIRLLIDDIQLDGRDEIAAAMAVHPNIELRTFNPFASRTNPLMDFLLDSERVNHRMHNKSMIVDNAVAIVGGRNIGDIYFQVADDANYRDLDIGAAGPIVREISDVFDYFWNGEWSVPIEALVDDPPGAEELAAYRETLEEWYADARETYPHPLDEDIEAQIERILARREALVWAPGWIIWDDPATFDEDDPEGVILQGLLRKAQTLEQELLIESAYFVPGRAYVPRYAELVDRGVRVRVLTNSLASNDVLAAHAGHAEFREDLLDAGVEIYEMRDDAGTVKQEVLAAGSRAGLHTKAAVFDNDSIFVGSFNFDPRSGFLNTEAGVYVESPELAAELKAFMDEGVDPSNAYHVQLDRDGELFWVTEEDGREIRLTEEPGATFTNQFLTDLIIALPVEDQL